MTRTISLTLAPLRPGDLVRLSPNHCWVTYLGKHEGLYIVCFHYGEHHQFTICSYSADGMRTYQKHPRDRAYLTTYLTYIAMWRQRGDI